MGRYLEAVKGKVMMSYKEMVRLSELAGHKDDVVALGKDSYTIPENWVVEPTYMTAKAVGADCFASEAVIIEPGEVGAVFTGIKAKFNGDSEGLFPFIRSSIPKKKGLILANGVGVIEEDYFGNPDNDGNIGFMFWNLNEYPVKIERFERIGQLVLMPVLRFDNAEYADNERGASGSTGK